MNAANDEDDHEDETEDRLQAIQAGGMPCLDNEVAHRAARLCILGNLSYQLGRKLHWDGEQERVIGDEQAIRLLSRAQRYSHVL